MIKSPSILTLKLRLLFFKYFSNRAKASSLFSNLAPFHLPSVLYFKSLNKFVLSIGVISTSFVSPVFIYLSFLIKLFHTLNPSTDIDLSSINS